MNRFAIALAALTGVVGFLLGLVVITSDQPRSPRAGLSRTAGNGPPVVVATAPWAGPAATGVGGVDFATVATRVNAAVVNVDAAVDGTGRGRPAQRWRRDLTDDPGSPREGSGAGFLIDPAGFLLTNFHVVDGADRITITLADGRSFRAEVVGLDRAIDVALLRIDGVSDLPVVVLGDSSTLRVGQWVCAIGNPLGYVHSVTVGVISFVGRKLFDQALDAYIQTDAAISFGNSGGPLVDADGRVIGMATAVSAQAANIGFAVPINQVLDVLPQLRERGRVLRGDLGAGLTRVTPVLERSLRLSVAIGALVHDVPAGSPADRAGLKPYDVIVNIDGVDVTGDDEVVRHIAGRLPGTVSELVFVRDGERRLAPVRLAERQMPTTTGRLAPPARDARQARERAGGALGLTVRDLDRAILIRRSLPDSVQGVVVDDVDPAGPARSARLRTGQIVLEINRQRVGSVTEFLAAVKALAPGEAAALLIFDPLLGQRLLVTVTPDAGA